MTNFDELVLECKNMEFDEGWKKIWTEVFSLEKILIAVVKPTTKEEEKEPVLFIGEMLEQPCVFAFTDMAHYEVFQKSVIETGDDRELALHEAPIQDFLNFTGHMSTAKVTYLMMNTSDDYGFHTRMEAVIPMYNSFIDGNHLTEHRIPQGTMIEVAVPEDINELKKAIEAIKSSYKNDLNSASPIILKIGEELRLMYVLGFKGGVPLNSRKSLIQKFSQELSPDSEIPIHFTEQLSLIPPNIKNIVEVKF